MDRRQYTPTKRSQLTATGNAHLSTQHHYLPSAHTQQLERSSNTHDYLDRSKNQGDYLQRSKNQTDYNERRTTPDYLSRNKPQNDYLQRKVGGEYADRSKVQGDYLQRSKANQNLSQDYPQRRPTTPDYLERSKATDYHRSMGPSQIQTLKQYQTLKQKVRQMQSQNRQLSNQIQKLRYQKNINQNKYLQKVSYQQDAISQFQKQKNYQLQLIKIKNDEDMNKVRRDYEFKLDDLQRELRNRDYQNRQFGEKNSYLELKINQLNKGIQILQSEHQKFKESNANIADHLSKEEFGQKRLMSITEQLQKQKCQMEEEIHVLLDIEAQKSRNINTLDIQLKNSEATERCLHDKLTTLTDNFAKLEEHIAIMKQRLLSTDYRNEQLEQQLKSADITLMDKDRTVAGQKELEVQVRRDLEVQQEREIRRQKQIQELIVENQRLIGLVNNNKLRLEEKSAGYDL